MPLPAALQCRLAKRGLLKHVEPGEPAWGGGGGGRGGPGGGGGGRSHRGEGGVVVLWAGPISYGRGQWEGVSGNVEPEGAWLGWVGVA